MKLEVLEMRPKRYARCSIISKALVCVARSFELPSVALGNYLHGGM